MIEGSFWQRTMHKLAAFHATSLLRLSLFVPFCVIYTIHSFPQHRGSNVDAVFTRPYAEQEQQQQRHRKAAKAVTHKGNSAAVADHHLPNVTLKYFPQAKRCKADWVQQYAALHHDILEGSTEPRYLVSVTAGSGLADKLVGTMTLLWNAVLTDRAMSVVTYPGDPGLSDVCDTCMFNWTQTPAVVQQDAVKLLRPKDMKKGATAKVDVTQRLPKIYDRSSFQALLLHNKGSKTHETVVYAPSKHDSAYLLVTTNRGRTYALANEQQYRQRFQAMGVPAADAFMCGFFFFCSPVAAVQQYYQQFWDLLSEPGVLRLGIQVRSGDKVIEKEAHGAVQQQAPQDVLQGSAHFFRCAERLEAAFATSGQKVIWFLNSDSQTIRQAAKAVYGDKLLTDDSLKMAHPECGVIKQDCEQSKLKWALQHSLGSMLTFSMTDVQVITQESGFGRMGAWLADRRDRMYELSKNGKYWSGRCKPEKPTPLEESSKKWSGI